MAMGVDEGVAIAILNETNAKAPIRIVLRRIRSGATQHTSAPASAGLTPKSRNVKFTKRPSGIVTGRDTVLLYKIIDH